MLNMGLEALSDSGAKPKLNAMVLLWQKDPFTGDRKYLILRKTHNGMWGLPGGGIEPGEDPKATAQRELTEETHLDHDNVRFSEKGKEFTAKFSYGKNPERTVHLYTAEYLTPKIPVNITVIDDPQYPNPEHFEFRFVSHKDELKRLSFGSSSIRDLLLSKLK